MANSHIIPSPQPLTYTYRTYLLPPNSPHLPFLTGKFSALSLRALSTDPGSFGMSYATECAFTPAVWTTRVTRPDIQIFICVAHHSALPPSQQSIEHGDWIGMVTQIGPTGKSEFWIREAGADEPRADAEETKWHQTALWIEPAHRGKGIAKLLIEAGVDYARASLVGSVRQARVRAFTGPNNEGSKGLYASRGFPAVGKCTISEAVVANGNKEFGFWGRWDWGAEMMEMRMGVIMERVVRREEGEGEGEVARERDRLHSLMETKELSLGEAAKHVNNI